MEQIPTAEAFFKIKKCRVFSNGEVKDITISDILEFTKLHVEAALKEATKSLPYDDKMNQSLLDSMVILNSYPLENIK
jgi:hypothetical protein